MSYVDEKTELEKRWEAEEDLHMEDNPYAASESEKESVNFNKGEDESLFIFSPIVKEEIPLVLITTNNRVIIGGLIDVMKDGIIIDHPMAYVEMADQRNPGRLQIGVQKLYHGLGSPDNMWFKHDSLNILRKEDAAALRVSSMYQQVHDDLQAKDAGVVPPSVNDLREYAQKKNAH